MKNIIKNVAYLIVLIFTVSVSSCTPEDPSPEQFVQNIVADSTYTVVVEIMPDYEAIFTHDTLHDGDGRFFLEHQYGNNSLSALSNPSGGLFGAIGSSGYYTSSNGSETPAGFNYYRLIEDGQTNGHWAENVDTGIDHVQMCSWTFQGSVGDSLYSGGLSSVHMSMISDFLATPVVIRVRVYNDEGDPSYSFPIMSNFWPLPYFSSEDGSGGLKWQTAINQINAAQNATTSYKVGYLNLDDDNGEYKQDIGSFSFEYNFDLHSVVIRTDVDTIQYSVQI